jgi:F420 biosynthesis protein FbiB-like protein
MTESFLHILFTRRSIRRYQPTPVPPDVVDALLQTAVWAPSAHNRQPWRFVVLTSAASKTRLATAMGQQLRHDLQADGAPQAAIARDTHRSYERITQAPLLIVLCLSLADMDSYPDERRQQNEYLMAVQSTAMAGQNLLLAAHAHGLGGCWMCAPLFCPDVVRTVLALPDDWQPQALLTLGYPAESKEKTRRPLADSVLYR